MDKEKDKIDDLIKESLTKEEAAFYEDLEERGLMGKMGEVFRGKLGWLAIIMNIVHVLVFVVFVYCVIAFMETNDVVLMLRWLALGFSCLIVMAMLKLYIWMQMNKNDILRELKRLELQMAAFLMKGKDHRNS